MASIYLNSHCTPPLSPSPISFLSSACPWTLLDGVNAKQPHITESNMCDHMLQWLNNSKSTWKERHVWCWGERMSRHGNTKEWKIRSMKNYYPYDKLLRTSRWLDQVLVKSNTQKTQIYISRSKWAITPLPMQTFIGSGHTRERARACTAPDC